jgi:hypothetical protein
LSTPIVGAALKGSARKSSKRGISLAHLKFRRRHEHEMRVYWHVAAGAEYAKRYWDNIGNANWPKTLALQPGDKGPPFSFVDLEPSVYLAHGSDVLSSVAGNALVSLVTAFEVYLFDVVQRTVFLAPETVADSDVTVRAGDIATNISSESPRAWFGRFIADRYCRNKTHAELIKRVGKLVRSDIAKSQEAECDEWYRWVLVRNSLVHLGGEVSTDLAERWPARFPTPGILLELNGADINRVGYVARLLVATLDIRFLKEVVGTRDQEMLARELYIRFGTQNTSDLALRVSRTLACHFSKDSAARAISEQKRGLHPEAGFTFTTALIGGPP